jgi:hypothetical protein
MTEQKHRRPEQQRSWTLPGNTFKYRGLLTCSGYKEFAIHNKLREQLWHGLEVLVYACNHRASLSKTIQTPQSGGLRPLFSYVGFKRKSCASSVLKCSVFYVQGVLLFLNNLYALFWILWSVPWSDLIDIVELNLNQVLHPCASWWKFFG